MNAKTTTSSNVTVLEKTGTLLPSFLQEGMEKYAGAGVSHSHEDNIVPLIYVLQSNSPVAKRNSANYIQGANAGDIWKKNSIHKEIIPSQEGIIFQPCFFEKVWIEWKPSRGGFVSSHKECPPDAREEVVLIEGKERKVVLRTNGNLIVETRQHVGYADGEPYVIPFSSTGHTVSRTWMQMMNQQFIPGTNKVAPSWAKKYKLTTIERTKDSNSWFVFKVEDAGWVDSQLEFKRGAELFEAFNKGEKKAEAAQELGEGEEKAPF
jgi:hypothetical protein